MADAAGEGKRLPFFQSYGLLAALTGLAFFRALDNGFISDDFVILERAQSWLRDPSYLFSIPPEQFRSLTYVFFLAARSAFGLSPVCFYVILLLVHAGNSLLLGRLVQRINPHCGRQAPALAACFFAVFERPQEAFLWLSASNELFVGSSLLLFLLCWLGERRNWALAFYVLALFSKESALVGLLLLPILKLTRGRLAGWSRQLLVLLLLSLGYGVWLVATRGENSLIQGGFYQLSPSAIPVLLRSTHRLAFPWLYLFGGLALLWRRWPSGARGWLGWMVVAQLPYIFLTYQGRLPSRHQYLAAMGLCAILALLVAELPRPRWRLILAALFVFWNVAYFWLRKDAQYEVRAAPTFSLIQFLREHPAERLRLRGFPLNPAIARLTTRLVAGWSPELILIDEEGDSCPSCPLLVWEPDELRYRQAEELEGSG